MKDIAHDVLLAAHVAAGCVGLAVGAWVIWRSRDRPVTDARAAVYHWSVAAVALTSVALVALDWPTLWWLVLVAAISYGLAAVGRLASRRRRTGWQYAYVHGQGGSYIALVTALLVVSLTVDGPIDGDAAVSVWTLPTLIGTAMIRAWHHRLDPTRANRLRLHWGRIRLPIVAGCLAVALVVWLLGVVPAWVSVIAFLAGMALYTRVGGPPQRPPIPLVSPVLGRWRAVNSPADGVPSHGVHAYGQSFAVDLVHEPRNQPRPPMGWWPLARRPERYPGFGRAVRSPTDGVVVRVHDGERDHWSRASYATLALLFVEAGVREITGPSRILGNHVVIDIGNGAFAAIGHLQRGSLLVRPGDSVAAGQPIGRCGNSGNSTEPHVHIQCMDHVNVLFADGIPFTFADVAAGVPSRREPFVA